MPARNDPTARELTHFLMNNPVALTNITRQHVADAGGRCQGCRTQVRAGQPWIECPLAAAAQLAELSHSAHQLDATRR